MNVLDTRVYRWLETATDFFLLNLMWLVACLPVVTIFPSTAAMFGVVRDWVRGREGSLTRTFITRFLVANQLSYWTEIVLKSLLVLVSTLYAFGSVYLFPVMVHYETDWKTVIKNSLLISIGRLPTTLVCLVFFSVMVGLTVVVPFLVVITGSITAYVVYRLCDREFRKIDAAHGDV